MVHPAPLDKQVPKEPGYAVQYHFHCIHLKLATKGRAFYFLFFIIKNVCDKGNMSVAKAVVL